MMPTFPPSFCEDESIYHTGPSHPHVHVKDLNLLGCSVCFIFSKEHPIHSSHFEKCKGPFIFVGLIKEEHYHSQGPFSIGAYAKIKEAFAYEHDNFSNDVYWHNDEEDNYPGSFGFSYNKIGEPSFEDGNGNGNENEDRYVESDEDDFSLSWPINQSGNHEHCNNEDSWFKIIYDCPGKRRNFII